LEKGQRKFKGQFFLSDLVSRFRVTANAITTKGAIGYKKGAVQTSLPFSLSFELPP